MRALGGQALLLLHLLARIGLALALAILLGLGALAWRLSQGPLELPILARQIEAQVNAPDEPRQLSVRTAAIAWEGWREGHVTPLEVRLSGVRVVDAAGAVRAALPDAAVSLSLPWLLRGHVAPRAVELEGLSLRLLRGADGVVRLDLGGDPLGDPPGEAAASDDPPPVATAPEEASPLSELLAELMRPPGDTTPRGALARLRIEGARIELHDEASGTTARLEGARLDIRRRPDGGLLAEARGTLASGGARAPLLASAQVMAGPGGEPGGGPAEARLRVSLPAIRLSEFAAAAPALAKLAGSDAPLRAELDAVLSAEGRIGAWSLAAELGEGRVTLGEGQPLAIRSLTALLDGEGLEGEVRLRRAALHPAPPDAPAGPAPGLTASGSAMRLPDGAGWRAALELALDEVAFADLPHYWPPALGGGERAWITENVTAGSARNGRWQIEARLPPGGDPGAIEVTALSGTAEAVGATVHWLRPVPPAERAGGTARFGLDAITLQLQAGRQGRLELREGSTIRFLFPPGGAPPTTEMQIQVAGPAADTLALLRHPRLKLFDRRPMPIQDAAGRVDARITLGFPLLADLPVELLRVRATARLTQIRVPDLLLGRALERATLDLTVDNDGLRVAGTGQVMEIPARLGVELDFRSGPASQVVMRETVTARAEARQVARLLDVPLEDVAAGPMAIEARTERRRNGEGRVAVRADLRDAALRLEPLAWAKPPGNPSNLEATLRLQGDELQAVESFALAAPELRVRGSANFGPGARLERVTITNAAVAASRFDVEIRPPAPQQRGAREPWRLVMRGALLDLRAVMAEEAPRNPAQPDAAQPGTGQAAADPPGASFAIDARFDRTLLGEARQLTNLAGELRVDGRGVVRAAQVTGRAGERGDFRLEIAPVEGGRDLRLTSEDGGALLAAFDVLQHVEGGRLTVAARYRGNLPGAALSGSAEMVEFSVREAPAVAKLLQAMTLYGLVEALRGPGLGFARLVAPFTLSRDALVLEDARAFSASLGLTAKGRLDRRQKRLEMEGTVVPAYIFNSLLGYIPLIGRLFSPEQGGGVFAATWRMQGPLNDPQVSLNPLAALTPGFLRGLFGIGDQPPQPQPQPAPARP